jgi:hypothetical protein
LFGDFGFIFHDLGPGLGRNTQYTHLLLAAWVCLILPIGGLVYMTRFWIFQLDSEIPAIALIMIWLLILSYCCFGVGPTAVYISRQRKFVQGLPWMLDILNLISKFPVPILVLIAFVTRPNGFQTC